MTYHFSWLVKRSFYYLIHMAKSMINIGGNTYILDIHMIVSLVFDKFCILMDLDYINNVAKERMHYERWELAEEKINSISFVRNRI